MLRVGSNQGQQALPFPRGKRAEANQQRLLHLTATPSSTLTGGTWTCQASGSAACPSFALALPAEGHGGPVLDLDFDVTAYGTLQFTLSAVVDAYAGGFASVTSRLEGTTLPHGSATTVIDVPLYGDGLFRGGFETSAH